MITKDLCTYAIKILRHDRRLRDHGTKNRLARLRKWLAKLAWPRGVVWAYPRQMRTPGTDECLEVVGATGIEPVAVRL